MSVLISLPSLFVSGTVVSAVAGFSRCNKLPGVPSFGAGLSPRIPGTNEKIKLN